MGLMRPVQVDTWLRGSQGRRPVTAFNHRLPEGGRGEGGVWGGGVLLSLAKHYCLLRKPLNEALQYAMHGVQCGQKTGSVVAKSEPQRKRAFSLAR